MSTEIKEYLTEYKLHLETEMRSLKNGSSLMIYQDKITKIESLLVDISNG